MSDKSCGIEKYMNKGVYIRGNYHWIGKLVGVTDLDLTIEQASMVNSSGHLFAFLSGDLSDASLDTIPPELPVTIDRAGIDITVFPVDKLPTP